MDPVIQNMIWAEKYRPKRVQDCILPASLKAELQGYVDQGFFPHLTLIGPSGAGKTSAMVALCEELGYDYIIINGSLEGNIDTLRTKISQFAGTVSLTGSRKCVIIDEADFLTNATQPALRRFMEEFSGNCAFGMTCNYPNRIMKELRGRTTELDFRVVGAEKKEMATQFFKRAIQVLDAEGVEYDKAAVAGLVAKLLPNYRKMLNDLQGASAKGPIDSEVLTNVGDSEWKRLYELLKAKNFTEIRKWVGENSDLDSSTVFRRIYDELSPKVTPETVPVLILYIADYQFKAAWVADPEINLVAFFVEVMANVEFKK